MLTTYIGDYPFFIRTSNEDEPNEPFCYQLSTITPLKTPTSLYPSICTNIPCQVCTLQAECNSGKFRTKVINNVFKSKFPEFYI